MTFTIIGFIGTDYEGGHYFGKLKFPPNYPHGPPSILMLTPSGRFQPNQRICMSMSDFHPETWCPSWSIGTLLTGLLSFMNSDEQTTGGIQASSVERKRLSLASKKFNESDKVFRELFLSASNVDSLFKDIDDRIETQRLQRVQALEGQTVVCALLYL